MLPPQENRILSVLVALAAFVAVTATQVFPFSAAAETKPQANAARSKDGVLPAPLASSAYPFPIPENATEIEVDGVEGELEFSSPSSMTELADFFRSAMSGLGWSEKPSIINLDKIVVIKFAKAEQKLSFTLMERGDRRRVSVEGEMLVTAAPKPEDDDDGEGDQPAPIPPPAEPGKSSI